MSLARSALRAGRVLTAASWILLSTVFADSLRPPILGDVYTSTDSPDLGQQAAAKPSGVAIKSALVSQQGPVCASDSACQSLCPTSDITMASPPLSAAAVVQQVKHARFQQFVQ